MELFRIVLRSYEQSELWMAGLALITLAFKRLPENVHSSLWEARVLFYVRSGYAATIEMLRLKHLTPSLQARIWVALARARGDSPDSGKAYMAAINLVSEQRAEHVMYLMEYAEWLFQSCNTDASRAEAVGGSGGGRAAGRRRKQQKSAVAKASDARHQLDRALNALLAPIIERCVSEIITVTAAGGPGSALGAGLVSVPTGGENGVLGGSGTSAAGGNDNGVQVSLDARGGGPAGYGGSTSTIPLHSTVARICKGNALRWLRAFAQRKAESDAASLAAFSCAATDLAYIGHNMLVWLRVSDLELVIQVCVMLSRVTINSRERMDLTRLAYYAMWAVWAVSHGAAVRFTRRRVAALGAAMAWRSKASAPSGNAMSLTGSFGGASRLGTVPNQHVAEYHGSDSGPGAAVEHTNGADPSAPAPGSSAATGATGRGARGRGYHHGATSYGRSHASGAPTGQHPGAGPSGGSSPRTGYSGGTGRPPSHVPGAGGGVQGAAIMGASSVSAVGVNASAELVYGAGDGSGISDHESGADAARRRGAWERNSEFMSPLSLVAPEEHTEEAYYARYNIPGGCLTAHAGLVELERSLAACMPPSVPSDWVMFCIDPMYGALVHSFPSKKMLCVKSIQRPSLLMYYLNELRLSLVDGGLFLEALGVCHVMYVIARDILHVEPMAKLALLYSARLLQQMGLHERARLKLREVGSVAVSERDVARLNRVLDERGRNCSPSAQLLAKSAGASNSMLISGVVVSSVWAELAIELQKQGVLEASRHYALYALGHGTVCEDARIVSKAYHVLGMVSAAEGRGESAVAFLLRSRDGAAGDARTWLRTCLDMVQIVTAPPINRFVDAVGILRQYQALFQSVTQDVGLAAHAAIEARRACAAVLLEKARIVMVLALASVRSCTSFSHREIALEDVVKSYVSAIRMLLYLTPHEFQAAFAFERVEECAFGDGVVAGAIVGSLLGVPRFPVDGTCDLWAPAGVEAAGGSTGAGGPSTAVDDAAVSVSSTARGSFIGDGAAADDMSGPVGPGLVGLELLRALIMFGRQALMWAQLPAAASSATALPRSVSVMRGDICGTAVSPGERRENRYDLYCARNADVLKNTGQVPASEQGRTSRAVARRHGLGLASEPLVEKMML